MQFHAPRPRPSQRTIPLAPTHLALIITATAITTAAVHAYASATGAFWQTTTLGAAGTAIAVFLWDREQQAHQLAQRLRLEVRGLSNRLGTLEAGQKDGLQLLSALIDEAQASASVWRDNEPVTFPDPGARSRPDPDDTPAAPDAEEIAERRKAIDPSGPHSLPQP